MTFPPLYHAHHSLYQEDLPFWLELAARQGNPVLELGCGTGRVLLPLAQAGYTVVGLDNDLEMLHFLRTRLDAPLMAAPRLLAAELSAFRLGCRFPLIILPCNTWSTLSTATRQTALQRVRAHLLPGGLFAVSLPNPRLFFDLPARSEAEAEEQFEHPKSGSLVQVSSAWRRTKRFFIVRWIYDALLPDGTIQQLIAEVRHDLAPVQAYLEEMQAAGLHLEAVYGDFDRSPYTPESASLILVAGI